MSNPPAKKTPEVKKDGVKNSRANEPSVFAPFVVPAFDPFSMFNPFLPWEKSFPFDPWSMIQSLPPEDFFRQACDYWVDAFQRTVLFVDVLRQRSNAQLVHEKADTPPVLHFEFELVLDGRKFVNPVNYQLFRIVPPEGVVTDPVKRPFIVFDPRAGHGPGIGGMKQDSEIGNTLRAGHPCYFVGFLPDPVLGQTVEHVCIAEAIFIARVIEFHKKADKPCLIGNCQAGWQISIVAAMYPELVGVLILAGAPLSYWTGVHGKFPMRYTGGMVGGSTGIAMLNDLSGGRFDGAALVENFEKLNPANTLWTKNYNLYSKVDTEAQRFLDFERWWGSAITLSAEEIQFIVDLLFIGNRLSTGKIKSSEGLRVDLRNIKTPIVVFCSHADDITPPQQALGWILDMYRADDEIIAAGQTIIYCLHQTIGHLGIFVSSSVASKEHDKFVKNIDMIETLPPGLYEAVFTDKTASTVHAEMASGGHVLRFVPRKLDDIRKLGGNSVEDDRCFATVKRVSETLKGLYETYMSPMMKACHTPQLEEFMRMTHPLRMRYRLFSDDNLMVKFLGSMAQDVKRHRKPVPESNLFWQMQGQMSEQIVETLETYRKYRDSRTEQKFFKVYGSPLLQAMVGLRSAKNYTKRTGRDVDRERSIQQRIHGLRELANVGGLPEAMIRSLLYVVRGGDGFDEREFNILRKLCETSKTFPKAQSALKEMIRQQHALLVIDEKGSMEAIARLLDMATPEEEKEALATLTTVFRCCGDMTVEEERRMKMLETYFVSGHTSLHRRASDILVFAENKPTS